MSKQKAQITLLKGKPVSDEFLTQLEEHTKALVEKLETITKDLHRPGDGSFSQTQANDQQEINQA